MMKKIYTKPLLEVTYIDNEISLIMMTDEYTPPDKPGPASGSAAQEFQPDQGISTFNNNFESNPFE